jgi:hypothetical protein
MSGLEGTTVIASISAHHLDETGIYKQQHNRRLDVGITLLNAPHCIIHYVHSS